MSEEGNNKEQKESDKNIIKGKWWDISKENKTPVIEAKYDRIKDWKMDPKGYFLIKTYPETKEIGAGFCTAEDNKLKVEIRGKTALEIVNTIIREEMISSLQHAADMGIELHKAETAVKNGLEYVQDDPLEINLEKEKQD